MFEGKLKFAPIAKSSVSSSDRELLEYEESITLKLEDIYQQEMTIRVIKIDFSKGIYQREIVMFGKKDNIPKELAHIKILMGNLNKRARKEVLEAKKPFGKILSDHKIRPEREIKNFFKVYKNGYISNHAKSDKDFFYGRNYLIFLANSKKLLAEVTEIFL
jgi:chorismate-pyruvate lyase